MRIGRGLGRGRMRERRRSCVEKSGSIPSGRTLCSLERTMVQEPFRKKAGDRGWVERGGYAR